MSLNRGKAKAKPAMKAGGKPAVMNRRKYDEAISGDTMSNYAMYKSGGKVKKYQAGKQVADSTGFFAQKTRDALKSMSPKNPGSVKAYEKAKENQMNYENRKNNTNFTLPKSAPNTMKKGGITKSKKFAALAPPYDKITFADKIAGAKKKKK